MLRRFLAASGGCYAWSRGAGLSDFRLTRIGTYRQALAAICLGTLGSAVDLTQAWGQAAPLSPAAISKALREQTIAPPDVAGFDAYFDEYFKNFVTPKRPFSLDDLPKLRNNFKIYPRTGRSGAAHDHLNEIAYKKMMAIVPNQKHSSAIRFNALLVLGDLNEVDDAANPVPWAKPFSVLLTVVKAAPAKVPDYLKVAALIGIERFAALKAIPQDKAADTTKLMLELVATQDPPAGRDFNAHEWMRRCAGQILALIGSPGADGSVVKALAAVMDDARAKPTIRSDMAQFLGQLKYPAGAKVDYQGLANSVGREVVDVCKQEIETSKAANRVPSRRLLAYVVTSASLGLEGADGKGGLLAAAAALPEHQKFIDTVRSKVKPLSTLLDDDTDDTTLAAELLSNLAALESTLVPLPAVKDPLPPKKAEAAQAAVDTKKPDAR